MNRKKDLQEGLALKLILSFRYFLFHFHFQLIVMNKEFFLLHTALNHPLDNIFVACCFVSLFLMEIHASVAWINLALLYMFILHVLYPRSDVSFDHHKPVWPHLGSEHLAQSCSCSRRFCTGPTVSPSTHCLFFISILRLYTSRHSAHLYYILKLFKCLVVPWMRQSQTSLGFTFLKFIFPVSQPLLKCVITLAEHWEAPALWRVNGLCLDMDKVNN